MRNRFYLDFVVFIFFTLITVNISWADNTQIAIDDAGVVMSAEEAETIIKAWPEGMRTEAINDESARLDYLSQSLVVMKMSSEMDRILKDKSGDDYWLGKITLDNYKANLLMKFHKKNLKLPDMLELAKEKYKSRKDIFGKSPEQRASSHILISCDKECDDGSKAKEKAVGLLQELKKGANFEKLVKEHSEDPGSKARDGSLGGAIAKNNNTIVRPYTEALFMIEKSGGFSDVIKSKFGYHIIRLDSITEEYDKTFDEVKDKIIDTLNVEYKKLATNAYMQKFNPTEKIIFDKKVIDGLFENIKHDKAKQ